MKINHWLTLVYIDRMQVSEHCLLALNTVAEIEEHSLMFVKDGINYMTRQGKLL